MVIRLIHPSYFDPDVALIRSVVSVVDLQTLKAEVDGFASQRSSDSFSRRRLKIRISGSKILKLGAKLLNKSVNVATESTRTVHGKSAKAKNSRPTWSG